MPPDKSRYAIMVVKQYDQNYLTPPSFNGQGIGVVRLLSKAALGLLCGSCVLLQLHSRMYYNYLNTPRHVVLGSDGLPGCRRRPRRTD